VSPLDSFSVEPPIGQRQGFEGWCQKAKANIKRIQESVQSVRICNGSQTWSKKKKKKDSIRVVEKNIFHPIKFWLEENCGRVLRILGGRT
jgi:hypothetical protein